jgi:hypothetical protein
MAIWSPETEPSARSDVERDVGKLIEEAINHVEHVLTPDRSKATDYYMGRPFGNEEQGRSQVVDTTVRDTVQGMLPSLLRIFLGSEKTVEFRPHGPEDEAVARQKTDYIRYIIREDNEGFLQFTSAFLDAMVRKLGIFKWWWEKKTRESGYQYEGLTEQDLSILGMEEGVTIKVTEAYAAPGDPSGQLLYNADVTRTVDESRARFEAIPPEEFLFTPTARCKRDALLLGHRRELRRSDLVAMDYDEDLLDEIGAYEHSIRQNEEATARLHNDASILETESDNFDPKYLYVEAFVRRGGSWRKYCTLGAAFRIVNGKGKGVAVDDPPFGLLPCVLEPHTIIGQSIADLTMDLQRINSAVLRGTIDSLGNSIMPQVAVDQYNVELQDLQHPEVSGIIRTKGPPANVIMPFKQPFVGSDTLPFLQYMNEVRENRTGQTKAAAGLDADALQSSTKAAVAATLTASQQRIEMLARTFAETGIKDLFRGLLALVIEHQDRERVIRLRNEYVSVDPRVWNADMDVTIHVGLGMGMPEEKMQALMAIAQKQETVMQTLGPVNPLTDLGKYGNTLGRMVELAGFVNSEEFFSKVDPQVLQQMTQAAGQDKKPSPEELLAQVQIKQIESDMQMKAADLQLRAKEMALEDDRERDKAAADFALKAAELELKYGTQVDVAQIKANAQSTRNRELSA